MQWINETIDAPLTGPVATGLDPVTMDPVATPFGRDLLHVLHAMQEGDFSVRVASSHDGIAGQIAEAVNLIAAANQRIAQQLERIGEEAGREGGTRQRIRLGLPGRGWSDIEDRLNRLIDLIDNLLRPTAAPTRAAAAVDAHSQQTTTELARSQRRLQDSEDGRILALAAGKMGSWDWDIANGQCLWDAGQRHIFGVALVSFEVAFPSIRALVDRGDWKMLYRQLRQARQNGVTQNGDAQNSETQNSETRQLEFRIRLPGGGVRWCLGMAIAARDSAGRVSHIRGITMDITERKEAEDRQSLLVREVDHRTRNALAVVHAIVSLTRADDITQFSAAVEGRIQALARAHGLLSDSRWHGAKIADLIQSALAPFCTTDPGRIQISGQSLALHPSAVQALALTIHELAANAVRHGALSMPSGRIQVAWEQHDAELALRWSECGAPCRPLQIQPLQIQEGLGMRIIRASVETQLCGSVEFDWRSDGLLCIIRIPCRPKTELFGDFLSSIRGFGFPSGTADGA
jgi:two-component sensor histidine kinase/PAS domain-containing protein